MQYSKHGISVHSYFIGGVDEQWFLKLLAGVHFDAPNAKTGHVRVPVEEWSA